MTPPLRSLFTSLMCLLPLTLTAQDYHSAEPAGSLKVEGDSTLHAWHVATETLEGGLTLEDGRLTRLQVAIPVETLASEKDGLNKNMYKAMKSDKFAKVEFVMTGSEIPETKPEGMEGDVRMVTGTLKILDATADITLAVTLEKTEDGTLTVTGAHPLDMTDFGVKPPKAMLGAIKTDPKVTVSFSWSLKAADAP